MEGNSELLADGETDAEWEFLGKGTSLPPVAPLVCLLSLHVLPGCRSSFEPSLPPHPDSKRIEPASLQNWCTIRINVSPPLMLTFGKITEVLFCFSARGKHAFTLTLCEGNKHVSGSFYFWSLDACQPGIINILDDCPFSHASKGICFM